MGKDGGRPRRGARRLERRRLGPQLGKVKGGEEGLAGGVFKGEALGGGQPLPDAGKGRGALAGALQPGQGGGRREEEEQQGSGGRAFFTRSVQREAGSAEQVQAPNRGSSWRSQQLGRPRRTRAGVAWKRRSAPAMSAAVAGLDISSGARHRMGRNSSMRPLPKVASSCAGKRAGGVCVW